MKNFLILCSIFILAFAVRLYNFEGRAIFWTEQARSLTTSLSYLDKPSLLGQEYFRWDSNSHVLYSGALFNYAMLPVILFSSYLPERITIFFVFINIFTGLCVFLVSKKFFGIKTAFYSSILFLFSNLMIYHSLFIWNYNLLPLVGIIITYLILLNYKEHKLNNFLWLGIIGGIGVSLQVLFALYLVPIFLITIFSSKQKILSTLMFLVGLIIGNLPMVLFDFRHDFYQTNTLIQYLLDTLHGMSDAGFAYYYLLPLVPVIAILTGLILSKINIFISIGLIFVYLYFNVNSAINTQNTNLTISEIDNACIAITKDARGDFNIASVIDFDKRAYAFRYLLKYKYETKVLPVEDYQNINLLYVIAPKDYDFKNSNTWEIVAGGKYKITEIDKVNDKIRLFKLQK